MIRRYLGLLAVLAALRLAGRLARYTAAALTPNVRHTSATGRSSMTCWW